MEISVEISYYPLNSQYEGIVTEFLCKLNECKQVEIKTGLMSTLIVGEYDVIMNMIRTTLKPFLERCPSIFHISIASACKKCEV